MTNANGQTASGPVLPPGARRDEPLAPLTTFRIGGAARYYAEPDTAAAGAALLRWAAGAGIEVLWLGGGSNLLIDDGGVDALVARPARSGFAGGLDAAAAGGVPGRFAAGGAASLARLVGAAAAAGLSGLEEWAAIPGTVGGALAMNAGGRTGLCELAESVETLEPDGTLRRRGRDELAPLYRDGNFGGALVARATFALAPSTPARVRQATAEAARRKARAQPLAERSAGCVFRNPSPERPAGRLIDEAGLKGARVGDALVSERHANFIVNAGRATAAQVRALMELVQNEVERRHGIRLQPEVRIWGRRENPAPWPAIRQ